MSQNPSQLMEDPTPILVLGVARSGTKWLCNEIGRHPDVAMIAHPAHGGVLESNLLSGFGRTFNFEDPESYRSFLDFWSRTHFFVIAGGRREDFETDDRPADSVEAFRRLLDDYARRQRASFWVQKIGPLNAEHVLQRIPDAKLVVITRELSDAVRSRLKLDRDRGLPTTAVRAAMSIALQMREISKVCRGRNALHVRYEALKSDREQTMVEVTRFLGLPQARLRDLVWPPNTSFSNHGDRAGVMGALEVLSVHAVRALVPLIPQALLKRLRSGLTRATAGTIPGTFYHLEEKGQEEGSRA